MGSKYACYTQATTRTVAVWLGSSNTATSFKLRVPAAKDTSFEHDAMGRFVITDASLNAIMSADTVGVSLGWPSVRSSEYSLDIAGSLNIGPCNLICKNNSLPYDLDYWSNVSTGIRYDGNVRVGSQAPAVTNLDVAGALNVGSLTLAGAPFTWSRWNNVQFATTFVQATSNIGIGITPAPAFALDVSGDINFSGGLLQNGNVMSFSQWASTIVNDLYTTSPVVIGNIAPLQSSTLTVQGDAQVTGVVRSTAFNPAGETWVQAGSATLRSYDPGWSTWTDGQVQGWYQLIDSIVTVYVNVTFTSVPNPASGAQVFAFQLPSSSSLPFRSGAAGTVTTVFGSTGKHLSGSSWIESNQLYGAVVFAQDINFINGEIDGSTSLVNTLDTGWGWAVGNTFTICHTYESGLAPVYIPPTVNSEIITQDSRGRMFMNGSLMGAASLTPLAWTPVQLDVTTAVNGTTVGTAFGRMCTIGSMVLLSIQSMVGSTATLGCCMRLPLQSVQRTVALGEFTCEIGGTGACVLLPDGQNVQFVGAQSNTIGSTFSANLVFELLSSVDTVSGSLLSRDTNGNIFANPQNRLLPICELVWNSYVPGWNGTMGTIHAMWQQIGFCVSLQCLLVNPSAPPWLILLPTPSAEIAAIIDTAVVYSNGVTYVGEVQIISATTLKITVPGFSGGATAIVDARITYSSFTVRVTSDTVTNASMGSNGVLRIAGGAPLGGWDVMGNVDVSGSIGIGANFQTTDAGFDASNVTCANLTTRVVTPALVIAHSPIFAHDTFITSAFGSVSVGGSQGTNSYALMTPAMDVSGVWASNMSVTGNASAQTFSILATGRCVVSGNLVAHNGLSIDARLTAATSVKVSAIHVTSNAVASRIVSSNLTATVITSLTPFQGDGSGITGLPGTYPYNIYNTLTQTGSNVVVAGCNVGIGVTPRVALDVSGTVTASSITGQLIDPWAASLPFGRNPQPSATGWWQTQSVFGYTSNTHNASIPSGGAVLTGCGQVVLYGPEGVQVEGGSVIVIPNLAGVEVTAITLNSGRVWILQTAYPSATATLAAAIFDPFDKSVIQKTYAIYPATARVGKYGVALSATDGRVVLPSPNAVYVYDPIMDGITTMTGDGASGYDGAVSLEDGRVMLMPFDGEVMKVPLDVLTVQYSTHTWTTTTFTGICPIALQEVAAVPVGAGFAVLPTSLTTHMSTDGLFGGVYINQDVTFMLSGNVCFQLEDGKAINTIAVDNLCSNTRPTFNGDATVEGLQITDNSDIWICEEVFFRLEEGFAMDILPKNGSMVRIANPLTVNVSARELQLNVATDIALCDRMYFQLDNGLSSTVVLPDNAMYQSIFQPLTANVTTRALQLNVTTDIALCDRMYFQLDNGLISTVIMANNVMYQNPLSEANAHTVLSGWEFLQNATIAIGDQVFVQMLDAVSVQTQLVASGIQYTTPTIIAANPLTPPMDMMSWPLGGESLGHLTLETGITLNVLNNTFMAFQDGGATELLADAHANEVVGVQYIPALGLELDDTSLWMMTDGSSLDVHSSTSRTAGFYLPDAVSIDACAPGNFYITPARSVALSDGTVLSMPESSNMMIRWDSTTGIPMADSVIPVDTGVHISRSVVVAPNGSVVMTTDTSNSYMIWTDQKGVHNVSVPGPVGAGIMRLTPHGRIVIPGRDNVASLVTGDRVPLTRCLHPMFR